MPRSYTITLDEETAFDLVDALDRVLGLADREDNDAREEGDDEEARVWGANGGRCFGVKETVDEQLAAQRFPFGPRPASYTAEG